MHAKIMLALKYFYTYHMLNYDWDTGTFTHRIILDYDNFVLAIATYLTITE